MVIKAKFGLQMQNYFYGKVWQTLIFSKYLLAILKLPISLF